MITLEHTTLAELLIPKVLEAGHLMIELRAKGLSIVQKQDKSPVTEADKRVEENLIQLLSVVAPDIPVVAEEEMASRITPYAPPTDNFFLIDPLDGTKDYCENGDDFTINIGLIQNSCPAFGLIYAPARCELFLTVAPDKALFAKVSPYHQKNSLEDLNPQLIKVRRGTHHNLHALVSRSEMKEEFANRLKLLGASHTTGMSSAIKFCLIARGEADLYPRFGATYEWDTAAGHAILKAAGGTVLTMDGGTFTYGKSNKHYLNGPFLACGAH